MSCSMAIKATTAFVASHWTRSSRAFEASASRPRSPSIYDLRAGRGMTSRAAIKQRSESQVHLYMCCSLPLVVWCGIVCAVAACGCGRLAVPSQEYQVKVRARAGEHSSNSAAKTLYKCLRPAARALKGCGAVSGDLAVAQAMLQAVQRPAGELAAIQSLQVPHNSMIQFYVDCCTSEAAFSACNPSSWQCRGCNTAPNTFYLGILIRCYPSAKFFELEMRSAHTFRYTSTPQQHATSNAQAEPHDLQQR